MKKVLFCASTLSHLMNFHLPYLQDFRDQGYEVWTLAGGGKARFIPYAHHQEDLPIRKRFFSPKNLLAILKVRRLLLRENFVSPLAGASEKQPLMPFQLRFHGILSQTGGVYG